METLDGKVAVVTGASRGIGQAVAVALAKIGAAVAVNYKTHAQEAEVVCAEIRGQGGHALAIQADVSVAADVNRMVRQAESQLGPVAVLVNNAGITRPQPIHEITEQDWDEVLVVNLKSVSWSPRPCCRACGRRSGAGSSTYRPWPPRLAALSARTMLPRRPVSSA
jgi:3-oxoacyl-[acyl-carrier protein] reductase